MALESAKAVVLLLTAEAVLATTDEVGKLIVMDEVIRCIKS